MRLEMLEMAGDVGVKWTGRLLNVCMQEGRIPKEWRMGLIVPIWKRKGDVHDPRKYRGITLLSQVLRVGRPKHKLVHSYTLHNQNLSETDSAKYLGLTITSDLQWNQHINNVTNKANSILGLLRRNLRIPSQTIKTHAYQSLVRPHLEYASTVWDPHTQKNIHKLDMVQRRAAR